MQDVYGGREATYFDISFGEELSDPTHHSCGCVSISDAIFLHGDNTFLQRPWTI